MTGWRQIRYLGIFFIALSWAAGIGQPSVKRHLDLGIHAGCAFTAMGDVNESIETMRGAGLDQNQIRGGISFSGRFLYALTDQLSLIFGAGMVDARTRKTIPIVWTSESGPEPIGTFGMDHMIDCGFVSVQTGVAFRIPFDSWSLNPRGTINYYLASLTESGDFQMEGHERIMDYRNQSKANGLGFELALNPVLPLSARLSVSGEAGYRFAKIQIKNSNFTPDNFNLDFSGFFINAGFQWRIL
jgi:hypothetical protein